MRDSREKDDFARFRIAEGLDLHVYPTSRFKTITLYVLLHGELGPDATRFALLPMVLRRGTRRFPSLQALTRFLDSLYGAMMEGDVSKRGENHLLFFHLSCPAPAYVPEGEKILREAFRFLAEVISDPRSEDHAFPRDVVAQEAVNLRRLIASLINNREHYAEERMIRAMCKGERFAVYEYGNLEDLDEITPENLFRFWKRTIRSRPVTLFVVGDVQPAMILELVQERFGWERDSVSPPRPTERKPAPDTPRRMEEVLPLEQEWVVQGYRIDADIGGCDFPAILYLNGLLGGFSFSKLFRNVREREGLAYEIGSQLERHKGLLLVAAGVKPGTSDRVIDSIRSSIESLERGEIAGEEMESARKRLLTEIRSVRDSAGALILAARESLLADRMIPLSRLEEEIARVTPEEVARLAGSLGLDTTFILRPEK